MPAIASLEDLRSAQKDLLQPHENSDRHEPFPRMGDFLVTGDKQHFGKMKELHKYPFYVVSPSEFIDSILPEMLKGLEEKE